MDFVNSYVDCLLDRISIGVLAEHRRTAIIELQSVVAETRARSYLWCNWLHEASLTTPRLLDAGSRGAVEKISSIFKEEGGSEGGGIVQEIQKILFFEGAFGKTFSIIKEEGGSEGGVVAQLFLQISAHPGLTAM
ncbi:hypothetical protein POM88_033612 [Heracleum sosnowskyi]|uniref:Uncharacterized protein n=1 Tax=Heracleum sosnowskyi TaxID=360622 RepID=A0AAD8HHP7_9APIA|nr:hypothetical protein POM88_033612 [Heracleum sosnowskyi]